MAIAGSVAVESSSYIFEGSGGMRDQLEQTILQEFQRCRYPLPATVKNVKAGRGLMGAVVGTMEQCVVIDVSDKFSLNIACTTIGTYLFVGVYLMCSSLAATAGASAAWAASMGDVFQVQKIKSYYGVALSVTEQAFATLGLKQANSGYNRNKE